ncbi:hypothetical protein STRAU_2859 [Streptomyces aurantiacus JA 4570]|uniref:Uncharacterized protein n=1 Tax=Streptomyces aurantiacus JA 4570 TaxID=1286094 RepID=S3ZLC7_9ACTN|nr:hypothetical protein STRAU_2859 [Streptomyces aurantiacus JA 4570]
MQPDGTDNRRTHPLKGVLPLVPAVRAGSGLGRGAPWAGICETYRRIRGDGFNCSLPQANTTGRIGSAPARLPWSGRAVPRCAPKSDAALCGGVQPKGGT